MSLELSLALRELSVANTRLTDIYPALWGSSPTAAPQQPPNSPARQTASRYSPIMAKMEGKLGAVGPYMLQNLVDDLPLDTPERQDVTVTCLESWGEFRIIHSFGTRGF